MNSTVSNLYKYVTNTLVCSTRCYSELFVEFEQHMVVTKDHSKGYHCNRRSLLGMDIESSLWCKENKAYYFDKKGKIHTLVIDFTNKTFKKV